MIVCGVCKKSYKSITGRHLKTHQLTMVEYKDRFPDAVCNIKTLVNLTCAECKEDFQGDSNLPKSLVICNNCRAKGKKIKNNTEDTVKKREETIFQKTGYSNPSQNPSIKEKKRNKELLKSSGKYTNPLQDPLNKEKRKLTCLKKYGTDNIMKVGEYKEKQQSTMLRKHGIKTPLQKKEFLDKMMTTSRERGGIGFENPNTKKKIEGTNFKKYRVDNYAESDEFKVKFKETCIEKYGEDNPIKVDSIYKKREETFQNNFEGGHPSRDPEVRRKTNETIRKNYIPVLLKYLKILNIVLVDEEYDSASFLHTWKCLKCNAIFKQTWTNIQQVSKCLECCPKTSGTSILETQVFEYVDKITNEYILSNTRKIIYPKELDIFIPSKNIAIEFDGLYWHSEEVLEDSKFYHLKKTELCQEKEIQLIHIFEDEWLFKRDIVKSRLKNILNIKSENNIYARKCVVKEIDPSIKNKFLEENHIQGKDASVVKLGAFYNNELISVMTFSKGNLSKGSFSKEGVWELNRFCSKLNYQVIGIAGKLLSYFKKNYEWKEIFSYADRRWSNGNLYYQLGFVLDHVTTPNYWYIKDFKRLHRFNFRKRSDEPKDIPEWVLRQKEGLHRIWDCGNLKFRMLKE